LGHDFLFSLPADYKPPLIKIETPSPSFICLFDDFPTHGNSPDKSVQIRGRIITPDNNPDSFVE